MKQDRTKKHADPLQADCHQSELEFQALGSRQLIATFDGGTLSTDGGALLLRDLDRSMGLTRKLEPVPKYQPVGN